MIQHKNRRLLIAGIIFVAFNILAFVIPFQRNAVFWVAYAFSAVTIFAQVAADALAFRNAHTLREVFYGVQVVKLAHSCLCAQLAVCAGLMIISLAAQVPAWVAVVPCTLILAFYAIAIIKANRAGEEIKEPDVNGMEESKFIYQLRADLETLMPRISDGVLKDKIETLSEAVLYRDLLSGADLAEMENKFNSLKRGVVSGGVDGSNLVEEISFLLSEWNIRRRALRREFSE